MGPVPGSRGHRATRCGSECDRSLHVPGRFGDAVGLLVSLPVRGIVITPIAPACPVPGPALGTDGGRWPLGAVPGDQVQPGFQMSQDKGVQDREFPRTPSHDICTGALITLLRTRRLGSERVAGAPHRAARTHWVQPASSPGAACCTSGLCPSLCPPHGTQTNTPEGSRGPPAAGAVPGTGEPKVSLADLGWPALGGHLNDRPPGDMRRSLLS